MHELLELAPIFCATMPVYVLSFAPFALDFLWERTNENEREYVNIPSHKEKGNGHEDNFIDS